MNEKTINKYKFDKLNLSFTSYLGGLSRFSRIDHDQIYLVCSMFSLLKGHHFELKVQQVLALLLTKLLNVKEKNFYIPSFYHSLNDIFYESLKIFS